MEFRVLEFRTHKKIKEFWLLSTEGCGSFRKNKGRTSEQGSGLNANARDHNWMGFGCKST